MRRKYIGYETVLKNGKEKKKRSYRKINDSDENWEKLVTNFHNEILNGNGRFKDEACRNFKSPSAGKGTEFVKSQNTISKKSDLYNWFHDGNLNGVANHESRSHLSQDLKRYLFASIYSKKYGKSPKLSDYESHNK